MTLVLDDGLQLLRNAIHNCIVHTSAKLFFNAFLSVAHLQEFLVQRDLFFANVKLFACGFLNFTTKGCSHDLMTETHAQYLNVLELGVNLYNEFG